MRSDICLNRHHLFLFLHILNINIHITQTHIILTHLVMHSYPIVNSLSAYCPRKLFIAFRLDIINFHAHIPFATDISVSETSQESTNIDISLPKEKKLSAVTKIKFHFLCHSLSLKAPMHFVARKKSTTCVQKQTIAPRPFQK